LCSQVDACQTGIEAAEDYKRPLTSEHGGAIESWHQVFLVPVAPKSYETARFFPSHHTPFRAKGCSVVSAPPMTQLTHDQVRHIAKLARLTLNDQEVEKFTTELTSILKYIDILSEVDTKGVEATAQVTGLCNSLRTDEIYPVPLAKPDDLLNTSPLPIEDHQIETKSAHG
jgi:aspartyl-tRNA(Asn)/glutamyl-tRNA(Gln) amidotransferase subunit C